MTKLRNITPHNLPSDIASLSTRIAELERLVNLVEVGFLQSSGWAGPGLLQTVTSAPWTPPTNCRLDRTLFLLGTAGSTSTVIRTKLDGTTIAETTIAASETRAMVRHERSMAADETILTYQIVTAGTSAQDLAILPRFTAR